MTSSIERGREVPNLADLVAHPSSPVVVLDGGLSTALTERGCDLGSTLWTASVLRDSPGDIRSAHLAYFEAGPQVATTATYQASVGGFVRAGMSESEATKMIRLAVHLAKEARDRFTGGRPAWVAASIGPYGATLADGSEYTGDYEASDRVLRDFHLRRMELLASTQPDLFAVETIPDVREAEVLVALLDEMEIPSWFCYSVVNGLTAAGQQLSEAFQLVAGATSVFAAGVNCCAPVEVRGALAAARDAGITTGVAYPNQGRKWSSRSREWIGPGNYDDAEVESWVRRGAKLVGGCCQVGPNMIGSLAAEVNRIQ